MARTPGRQPTPPKKKPDAQGRVTQARYCKATTDRICELLAEGKSWSGISKTKDMPSYSTLYAWQKRHPDFAEKVAQAREVGADFNADKALEVAEATTAATVSADRLKVSTLMRRAALTSPRRWGGKPEKAEPVAAGPKRFAVRIRQFERVVDEHGRAWVRELFPGDEGYEP